ncbi:MAG: glycosyltransferase family 8 protein, partial [Firmicutes bacterium]|nr:glycosyltransferase family 8 protein [Bacillota bacterium]
MQKDLPIPFFEQPNAIVLAANNFYVPYLSTLLQSIKAHTNTSNFYDIIVLTRDISQENQQELVNQVCCNNINIRFFDVSEFISKLKGLQTPRQLTVETYYRLFMQDILAHYDVALYMDCDMICQDDVSKLFDIDIKEYHLAACRDVAIIAHYNKNCIVGFNKYVKQRLQLDDISNYFQAGLILFNLNNMRQDFVVDEILSLATTMQWQYQDQDLLNYMMSTKGKVKYLDLRWNYVRWHLFGYKDVHSAKEFVPQDIYAQYNDANQD